MAGIRGCFISCGDLDLQPLFRGNQAQRRLTISSGVKPSIAISLLRPVAPLTMDMEDFLTSSNRLSKSISSRLALPFSGGAAIFTWSLPPEKPATSFRLAPGWTFTGSNRLLALWLWALKSITCFLTLILSCYSRSSPRPV
jgi:hypothetical protein